MQLTPKLKLKKPDLTDSINVQDLNDNVDVLDTAVSELQEGSASIPDLETNDKTLAGAINEIKQTVNDVETNAQQQLKNHEADYVKHPGVGINGLDGSANKLTLTLAVAPTDYKDNMGVLITPQTNTTAAATLNVNDLGYKSILKANGNAVTNLKAGVIYTLRYSSNKGAFILQGEGGSGNAQPSEVLTGKTFTNDSGEQVGTMIKGAYIKSWQWGQLSFTIDEKSKTVNINAVNRNKAIIRVMFNTSEGITASSFVVGSFINDSSISFTRNDKGYQGDSFLNVIYEVYEFDDSIKLQWGGTAILNSNVVNITLNPTPNLSKCLLFYHFNDNSNEGGTRSMVHSWRNGNQLNFARGRVATHQITTIYWFLVEFP